MTDYDPLPDLASLVRAAFDYNTIDANHYAERLAQQFDLIEFEDDEDGRPVPLDAEETRSALAKALTSAIPVREQAAPDPAAFPLTCEYCDHASATHLLVADLSVGRVSHVVCAPCGTRNVGDARKIAKSASSAWLFALVPDDLPDCKGGVR